MGPKWVRVLLVTLASLSLGGLAAYDLIPGNLRCRDVVEAVRILLTGGLYDRSKAVGEEGKPSTSLEC